jgi:hypothetical protein
MQAAFLMGEILRLRKSSFSRWFLLADVILIVQIKRRLGNVELDTMPGNALLPGE